MKEGCKIQNEENPIDMELTDEDIRSINAYNKRNFMAENYKIDATIMNLKLEAMDKIQKISNTLKHEVEREFKEKQHFCI